jgi:hypothetical protein
MSCQSNTTVPSSAVRRITEEICAYGQRCLETGGFLMAPRGGETITVVALAGARGVVRRRHLFQISERALDRLFIFADDHDLYIPAQFHSHELDAFLSWTDAEHGLRVDGFTSAVIPTYADPPADMRRWGWWSFTAGDWAPGLVPTDGAGLASVVRFDEDGVINDGDRGA